MLIDYILVTVGQNYGDYGDDDEIEVFPTFDEDESGDEEYTDGDEDGEEDDVDEDSLLDEEDIEEDVDEDLPMEDGISAATGLVFAPKDLAE